MGIIPLLINRLEDEGENEDTPSAIIELIGKLAGHGEAQLDGTAA